MRNKLFLSIFGLLLISSCESLPLYQSVWQATPVTVDGDISDWQRPLAYYDADSKLSFTVSNDSTKLYFMIEAYDEPTQMKIIREGLQLWIDTSGGKSKEIGILYPVAAMAGNMPKGADIRPFPGAVTGNYGSQPDFDRIATMRRNFLKSPGQIELKGFKPPIGGLLPLKNAFGIQVSINWDTINNILNWEAAIPLEAFYRHSLNHSDSLKNLGITFALNGIDRSAKKKSDVDEGYSPSGGMGGGGGIPGGGSPGGGGRGGGGHRGGGGGSSQSNALSESSSVSIRFRLAAPGSN